MRIAVKAAVITALLLPLAAAAEAAAGNRAILIFVPDTDYRLLAGESRAEYRDRVRADARSVCAPGPSLGRKASRLCEAAVVDRAEASLRRARPVQTASAR